MRVLLICDLEDWILGEVARNVAQRLSDYMPVTVRASNSDRFQSRFHDLQREHDVVHFLSPWDFYALGKRTSLPTVLTLWHMVDWGLFDTHVDRIDTLCVTSEQWMDRVRTHILPELPTRRVRYGLDTDRFARDHSSRSRFLRATGLGEEVLTFGFAGKASSNQQDRKGLDRLWACLLHLKAECELSFVVRVAGPDWPQEMIHPELRSVVQIEPYIDSQCLPEFYSSLDYYVCTSRQEGGPYPVLEAMSCECVVLSTPVGVVPEILAHGENGFFLREQTLVSDFVDIVRHTAHDREFRTACGQAARDTVARAFSWNVVVDPLEYRDIYNTAMRFYASRPARERLGLLLRSSLGPRIDRLHSTPGLSSAARRVMWVRKWWQKR